MPGQCFDNALALRRGPGAVKRRLRRWHNSFGNFAGKNVSHPDPSAVGKAKRAHEAIAQFPNIGGPIMRTHRGKRFGLDRQRRHAEFRRDIGNFESFFAQFVRAALRDREFGSAARRVAREELDKSD